MLRSLYRLDVESKLVKTHEKTAALLNVYNAQAFDSVWLDGWIYKLKNLKINGKMIKMIDAFLRPRKGQIDLEHYTSPMFNIHFGLPQGIVLSTVLFIFFISDFLSNSIKRFKSAYDCSVSLSGQTIAESLMDTCLGIAMWRRRWRRAEHGPKTKFCL